MKILGRIMYALLAMCTYSLLEITVGIWETNTDWCIQEKNHTPKAAILQPSKLKEVYACIDTTVTSVPDLFQEPCKYKKNHIHVAGSVKQIFEIIR